LYWWINRPPVPINLPPTATGPWIAFGDSLTEGYVSDAIHPNDEGYKRFAERLEKVLRPLLPRLTGDAIAR